MTLFKDALVMSGAGVGGGSIGYAMTLYVPPKAFFEDPQWAGLADWQSELAPHYETAQRMLGVTDVAPQRDATSTSGHRCAHRTVEGFGAAEASRA
jgi:choline dehydrogenase-like flavoprotein